MQECKKILYANRWFIYPYITLLMFSIVVLFLGEKNEIQSLINKLNNPFFDVWFSYATILAEGSSIFLIIILTLFIQFRWTILTSLALLYNTILVFIFKNLLFSFVERPKIFFSKLAEWHTVKGIDVHSFMSFPSGHTAAAFCLFFSLTVATKSRLLGLFLFFCSGMVGYSRLYLSQHYLRDVVVGSIIGIMMVIIAYFTIHKNKKINNTSWINKNIQQLLYAQKK